MLYRRTICTFDLIKIMRTYISYNLVQKVSVKRGVKLTSWKYLRIEQEERGAIFLR